MEDSLTRTGSAAQVVVQSARDPQQAGVYFSANDAVLPWAIAFLNSFRRFNPDLPLYLIPFNEHCRRLRQLSSDFQFRVYEDPAFDQLEKLGRRYEIGHSNYGPYWFRRYAAFWGPLKTFIYLDVRQLVLSSLELPLKELDRGDVDLIYFDSALNQVFEEGDLRRSLVSTGRGHGFMSGMWGSRQHLFSLQELLSLGNESLEVRSQLNPRNTDQAFINYCCDKKQVRYAHFGDLNFDACRETWARSIPEIYLDTEGEFRVWDHGGLQHKKKTYLLHWAGLPLRSSMPHRRLFLAFRDMRSPRWQRVGAAIADLPIRMIQGTQQRVRSDRRVNQLYHSLFKKHPSQSH